MHEWLKRVRQVQQLVGGAQKYYLPSSVEFLKTEECFWLPEGGPVDILQVWEEDLVPQIKYGYGFAFQARQVMVCRGGILQVDLFDGVKSECVSLAYGHVLYIPPCVWYTFFTKSMGVKRSNQARVQTFTDADLHGQGWFCKMHRQDYAIVRNNMQRR